MENTTSKFVKEVKARQQKNGNTYDPLANEKNVLSALNSQIKMLTSIKSDIAKNLVKAQSNHIKVGSKAKLINNTKAYLEKLLVAQQELTAAEEAWYDVNGSIDYFTDLKKRRF